MQRTLLLCLGQLTIAYMALIPRAGAQSLCIPEVYGVPNLGSGTSMYNAPNWWSPPTIPTGSPLWTRLDDPRWNGAVSQDMNGEVTFRALHRTGTTTDTLLLSWTAKIDQSLETGTVTGNPPTGDQLIVGLLQKTGTAILFHFGLLSTAAPLDAANNASMVIYPLTGTTLSPAIAAPPWINATLRTWTDNNARWTFQMAVPIAAGNVNAGLDFDMGTKQFQMFYAFLVDISGTYVEYRWPSALPVIRSTTSNPVGKVTYPATPPTEPNWGTVSWGASGTSGTCAGDVALDGNQIGVGDPPVSNINFTILNNLITAKPQNISINNPDANPIPPGRIQADFFLSNYGTQPNGIAAWDKISPATAPINTAPIPPGGFGVIKFSWPTAPVADPCKYIEDDPINCPSPGISDQCILVQLSEVTPPPPPPPPPPPAPPPPPPPMLVFRNQSTWNNMLFKHSSTLRHRAQISVVGLTPLADNRTTRDVYLYVETVNMPARVSSDALSKSPVVATRDTLIVARRDTTLNTEWGVVRLGQGDSVRMPIRRTLLAAGASPGKRFAAVREAAAAGKLTVAQVDSQVPTYRIHAYHATGDSLGKLPILEAQTSFGYWVEHDGEIMGWRHHIEGEHLVRLAPNYYKIEVPNNSRSIITTVIEPIVWKPFALSLHAGMGIPSGNFKNTNDPGLALTGDLEYWLSRSVAVEGLFGYHRFPGTSGNPDLELFHTSGALELRITSGSPSIIVEGGGGYYNFNPGSSDPGVHGGASLEFDVSPYVSLGATGRIHSVSTSGSKTTFYSVQAGGRIRL